jgi:hypothetical protein
MLVMRARTGSMVRGVSSAHAPESWSSLGQGWAPAAQAKDTPGQARATCVNVLVQPQETPSSTCHGHIYAKSCHDGRNNKSQANANVLACPNLSHLAAVLTLTH